MLSGTHMHELRVTKSRLASPATVSLWLQCCLKIDAAYVQLANFTSGRD